ncbi:acetyl xylan esterase [Microbacterium sp. CH12i]|uniref:acetylxylan esterase n=1 Tax=Microbacterium sp. CH12i TaxID=1479651 RepID=UPI00046198D5|nr:acetylxylan esterase [Microbacterium sp. CH12i]KDA06668.1 acetyl xylan esterase [Microbacterium sp. CH12i]
MPLTDLPIDQLQAYRPAVAEPEDFDEFWRRTLDESRAAGGTLTLDHASTPISELIVEDLTFPGYGGEPIRAWVTRPRTDRRLPAVIEYIGYNGGRGVAGEKLQWAAAGYVYVLMDTRGQGSGWGTGGDTADPHGSEGSVPGFMTRGIASPETYYYRRVFTDAVRLVDAVRMFDFVDASRVSVTGASQGGGIALAVGGLVPGLVGVMPDVPFLCHFGRSVQVAPDQPFTEITRFLAVHRDQDECVFRTLSYFDGVNFARRVQAPALFSVALMDGIVLPSSVFAAYNHLGVEDREIEVYTYNGHEGGQTHQWVRQAQWLATRAARG